MGLLAASRMEVAQLSAAFSQLVRVVEENAVTTEILSTTAAYQRTYLDACRLRIRGLEEEVLRLRRVTPMAISVLMDEAGVDNGSGVSTDATSYYGAEEEEGGGSDGSNVGESSMGNDGASSVHPVGEFPYEDNVGYPPGLSESRSSGANGESTSGYLTGGVPADDRTRQSSG